MAIQLSTSVRNARLDQIETTISTSARLKFFTGAQPANCAAADSGTLLVDMTLPSDYLAAASGGTKAKSGTWQDTSANGTGTAAHWRLYETTATTCHAQGSITATGGGGDLELDSTSITTGQIVTVTAWTFTDGNA